MLRQRKTELVSSTDPDLATLRDRLEQRLHHLRASSKATAEDRRPVELDQASVGRLSRMDAMQVQAMAVASEQMRAGEIRKTEAAIERLDAGDYGYCVTCGEEIAAKRLIVDPIVATCIQCAAAAQRR
jgi:DnaK suppressor protein